MHGQSEMLHHFGGCIHAIQPSPAALCQPLNPSHPMFSLKTPCFACVQMARVDIYMWQRKSHLLVMLSSFLLPRSLKCICKPCCRWNIEKHAFWEASAAPFGNLMLSWCSMMSSILQLSLSITAIFLWLGSSALENWIVAMHLKRFFPLSLWGPCLRMNMDILLQYVKGCFSDLAFWTAFKCDHRSAWFSVGVYGSVNTCRLHIALNLSPGICNACSQVPR